MPSLLLYVMYDRLHTQVLTHGGVVVVVVDVSANLGFTSSSAFRSSADQLLGHMCVCLCASEEDQECSVCLLQDKKERENRNRKLHGISVLFPS